MNNFVKWVGGALGWVVGEWFGVKLGFGVGGLAGGLVGFVAGTVIDSFEIPVFRKKSEKKAMSEFSTSLLVLIAAVMRADRRPVVRSELDCVKQFLKQNFGKSETVEALTLLKEMLKKNIPVDDACSHIRYHLDYSSRLQFTHFLCNLANVDRYLNEAEQHILNIIDNGLRVNISDKRSIGPVDVREEEMIMAYGTLGIHRTDSVIDIKKAYRTLANKCHPDKVAFLGEEQRKAAKDKFQRLTQAYDLIKRDKNFT